MTIRVVVADDQEMVRRGIGRILACQPDIEVIGETSDGVSTVDVARRLQPDVLVLDIRMPLMSGIEVTRVLASSPSTSSVKVVVMTTFDLDEYVYPALRHGASGFLLKRSGPTLLVEAVRAAVAGDKLICPSITVRLLKHLTTVTPPPSQARDEPLTAREIEIAAQVAEGKTNAEIAAALFISPGTVKTHVAHIQRKLSVPNRVGVAVAAWERGYVNR